MFMQKCFRGVAILLTSSALALGGAGVPAAMADGAAAPSLSLQQAVQMAQDTSTNIKADQDAILAANNQTSQAQQQFQGFTPSSGFNENSSSDSVFKELAESNITQQQAATSLNADIAKVTLDTFTDYYAVAAGQAAMTKDQADIDRDQQLLLVANAMFDAGLNTDADVAAAKSQAETSAKALASDQNVLDKAYTSFNQEVGLPTADQPVLTDQMAYSEFDVNSLDAEVSKALASSNTIAQLQELASLAQLNVNFPYTLEPIGMIFQESEQTEPNLEAAQQNVIGASNNLGVQVRNLYQDIKSLEDEYASLQSALQSAQDNLKNVQAQYDVGLTTMDKVKAAEAAVADIQGNITALVYNHGVMVANFHWLAGEPVFDQ